MLIPKSCLRVNSEPLKEMVLVTVNKDKLLLHRKGTGNELKRFTNIHLILEYKFVYSNSYQHRVQLTSAHTHCGTLIIQSNDQHPSSR